MLQSRVETVNEAGDVQFLFRKKNIYIYISVYEYFSFRFSVDAVVARYKHEHIVENLSLKEPVSRVSFFPCYVQLNRLHVQNIYSLLILVC